MKLIYNTILHELHINVSYASVWNSDETLVHYWSLVKYQVCFLFLFLKYEYVWYSRSHLSHF